MLKGPYVINHSKPCQNQPFSHITRGSVHPDRGSMGQPSSWCCPMNMLLGGALIIYKWKWAHGFRWNGSIAKVSLDTTIVWEIQQTDPLVWCDPTPTSNYHPIHWDFLPWFTLTCWHSRRTTHTYLSNTQCFVKGWQTLDYDLWMEIKIPRVWFKSPQFDLSLDLSLSSFWSLPQEGLRSSMVGLCVCYCC